MGRPMTQCERCAIRSYQTIEDEYAELNYNFRQIEDKYQLLLSALRIISTGIEYADGEPFIDGSTKKATTFKWSKNARNSKRHIGGN